MWCCIWKKHLFSTLLFKVRCLWGGGYMYRVPHFKLSIFYDGQLTVNMTQWLVAAGVFPRNSRLRCLHYFWIHYTVLFSPSNDWGQVLVSTSRLSVCRSQHQALLRPGRKGKKYNPGTAMLLMLLLLILHAFVNSRAAYILTFVCLFALCLFACSFDFFFFNTYAECTWNFCKLVRGVGEKL